jgi:hypothetical protein
MVRRDEFIQRYAEQNSLKNLKNQITELEKFVDGELIKNENLLNIINKNDLTLTNGEIDDNQFLISSISSDSIHRDQFVLDNNNGRSGPNRNYAIWGSNLTNSTGGNESLTPWEDLTLNIPVTGELRITLPEFTNKNAAYLLCQKYLQPLKLDSNTFTDEDRRSGFWGRKPLIGTNNSTAGLDANAVRLMYDKDTKRFILIFKL